MTSATSMTVADLVRRHLADPYSSWSVGTYGALAEFVRTADESAELRLADDLRVTTESAALRFALPASVRAVAYETADGGDGWGQAVALCLPRTSCAGAGRTALTELGPDRDALRERDRHAVLFDLGLGTLQVDVCVRSDDPDTVRELRAGVGRSLFEPGNPLAGRMPALSPHRVFVSRLGRAEVYTAIPPADGVSPSGPHTHILPGLLGTGRTHGRAAPIPEDWVPCAHLYPADAQRDAFGNEIAFDRRRYEAFQEVLDRFGDPDLLDYKRRVCAAVRAGAGPGAVPEPATGRHRTVLRVALRQLARLDGPSALLRRWHDTLPAGAAPTEGAHGVDAAPSHPGAD